MMESCGTNCPSSAAPSVVMVTAPEETASTTSREPPSWPPGKPCRSMRPPDFSFTSFAARSIIWAAGWLGAWFSAQRRTVAWA